MVWNWQQSDWPDFAYDSARLAAMESRLLHESGLLFGAFAHLDDAAQRSLTEYIAIARTSRATATRDLQDLVAKGALVRTGERKHTRYALMLATDPGPHLGLSPRPENHH